MKSKIPTHTLQIVEANGHTVVRCTTHDNFVSDYNVDDLNSGLFIPSDVKRLAVDLEMTPKALLAQIRTTAHGH